MNKQKNREKDQSKDKDKDREYSLKTEEHSNYLVVLLNDLRISLLEKLKIFMADEVAWILAQKSDPKKAGVLVPVSKFPSLVRQVLEMSGGQVIFIYLLSFCSFFLLIFLCYICLYFYIYFCSHSFFFLLFFSILIRIFLLILNFILILLSSNLISPSTQD